MTRFLIGALLMFPWLAAPAFGQTPPTNAVYGVCTTSGSDSGGFADCTTALCTDQGNGNYSCTCNADPTPGKKSAVLSKDGCVASYKKDGTTYLQSRFPGLQYVQLCGHGYQPKFYQIWANCLDIMCTGEGKTVNCVCKTPPPNATGNYPYVINRPSGIYDEKQCVDPGQGVAWSSASYSDALAVQKYLNGTEPKVVNPK